MASGPPIYPGGYVPPKSGTGSTSPDPETYSNPTGATRIPTDVWKGANRPGYWNPPDFLQTYGNYTGLFPSLGQQIGQALYGSIQANPFMPSWAQTTLPPRATHQLDQMNYGVTQLQPRPLFPQSDPQTRNGNWTDGYQTPFQRFNRISTPYPLNGRVLPNQQYNASPMNFANNPFIGAYRGLSSGGLLGA